MKKKIEVPAPAKGPGHPKVGGSKPGPESLKKAVKTARAARHARPVAQQSVASAVPAAIAKGNALRAAASGAPAGVQAPQAPAPGVPAMPKYNEGLAYNTPNLRYPTLDPVPALPLDEGAKVKMGLKERNNQDVANFTANHIFNMTGNSYFPAPMPPAAEFDPVYDDYVTKLNSWLAAQTAMRDAYTALSAARVQLDSYLNVRAAYVQSASNGNANVIVSSGFEVRSARRPVGELAIPTNLMLEPGEARGVMYLTWATVLKARGYNIQCSLADTMERDWRPYETTTQARYKCSGLELGKMYAFRIAAVGGSTGQSDWSEEVIRMAA